MYSINFRFNSFHFLERMLDNLWTVYIIFKKKFLISIFTKYFNNHGFSDFSFNRKLPIVWRKCSKVSHQFVSDYRQIPYFPIKKKKKKIRQEVPRRESKPRSMLVARSSETKRYINWIVTRQPALEGKNEFPSITESSSQPLAANYQLNCLPLDINLLTCPFLTSSQRLYRATCIPSTCHRSNSK